MDKVIKKYGHSMVISFTKDERRIFKIKEGQIYRIEMTLVVPYRTLPHVPVIKRNKRY